MHASVKIIDPWFPIKTVLLLSELSTCKVRIIKPYLVLNTDKVKIKLTAAVCKGGHLHKTAPDTVCACLTE